MKRLLAITLLAVWPLLTLSSCGKAPSADVSPGSSSSLPDNQTSQATQKKIAPGVGDQAPELTLTDMNDKTVSLADYRGQIVWLNFWATW